MLAWKACTRCSDDEVFDTTAFETLYNFVHQKKPLDKLSWLKFQHWAIFGCFFCCLLWGIKHLIRGRGMTQVLPSSVMQRWFWVSNGSVVITVIVVVPVINVVQLLTIKEDKIHASATNAHLV